MIFPKVCAAYDDGKMHAQDARVRRLRKMHAGASVCQRLVFLTSSPCVRAQCADGDEAAIVAAARNMTLNFSNKQWSGDGMELAQDFVRSCMMTDRHARPHAEKLLHHPWLAAAAPSRANGVNAAFIQMLDETTAIERAAKLPSAAPAP